MNERNTFLYKNIISHTLFLMFLWCVRDEWRQGQTAILTQLLLLTIACCVIFKNPLSTSLHLGWGCSTRGCCGPQPSGGILSLQAGSLAFLSPTLSTAAGTCQYSFITPTSSASSAYSHRCISDWWIGQGSIYNTILNSDYVFILSVRSRSMLSLTKTDWL